MTSSQFFPCCWYQVAHCCPWDVNRSPCISMTAQKPMQVHETHNVFSMDLKIQSGDGDMGTVADKQNCSVIESFVVQPLNVFSALMSDHPFLFGRAQQTTQPHMQPCISVDINEYL